MTDRSQEEQVQRIGRQLLEHARREEEALVKAHHWEFLLLDWCMHNPELKTRVFRFIDVFPQLKSPQAVLKHIREYFPREDQRLPKSIRAGLLLAHPDVLARGPVDQLTRILFERIAKMFIAASDEQSALEVLETLDAKGVRGSVDLLGERTLSDEDAESYFKRYKALIAALGKTGKGVEKQNVSVKLSALDPRFDVIDPQGSSRRVRERLRELVRLAKANDVFIHIDMEEYEVRDLTLQIVKDLLTEQEFYEGVDLGIVVQAYLRDAAQCLDNVAEWARKLPKPLTIRLVRGAYWDQEILTARDNNWPVPVFMRKNDTDWMFEHLTERILKADCFKLAVATHNIRSIAHAIVSAEALKVPAQRLEFQLLYGMGDSLIPALQAFKHSPRMYMPIGDSVLGMAYLVRRLLENVSSQSFVRRGIHSSADESVLAPPKQELQKLREYSVQKEKTVGFGECPPLRFSDKIDRQLFDVSLSMMSVHLGQTVPTVINGKPRSSGKTFDVYSPADPGLLIAKVVQSGPDDVEAAVTAAEKALPGWMQKGFIYRAECLRRAAQWMLRNRADLAAIQIQEVGKTRREADADVKEAVDFLNYYAYVAEGLERGESVRSLPQESNRLMYRPRGVSVVIAPWNFPMAILTGMSAAALVTGNTVILKPAEQSPFSGWKVFEAFREGGIPDGVIHLINGDGRELSPSLVEDPRVALIAFTGSKEAGLDISTRASAGRNHRTIKKVICETGGKNAMIIDETADFDAAVPACLHSAFGFAGQKCSALSRLIILESVYEEFLKRLIAAAHSIVVGDPREVETHCPPVIDENAQKRILAMIRKGQEEGQIVFRSALPQGVKGHYVPLTIITDLKSDSSLLKEEIFGPVLCVLKAKDFNAALKLANDSDFALTGGVFSRTPSHIERVKRELDVGNLYINRSITGAIVGRHPFGGYKMSGTGTKAGGAVYLKEFLLQRTISENLARHGFAPLQEGELS